MKKNLLYIVFVCSSSFVFGQINIQDDLSLTTLVENLQGTGVEISNITYDCEIGSNNPFGRYVDASSTTGLTEGLILTTGSARNAVGPNKNAGKGDQNSYDEKFDSDLSSLVTSGNGAFYDICKVEFDISIYSNELSFKYVFGSEEYPEFVGSYHDLFGFFISGPGIVGAQNLALIPFSNDPVSVSTVNSNTNVNWYNSNGDGMIPPYSEIMQYDGYTDVLTAKLEVAPCETYHIKIIIADEGDGIYDSGIFLEAGSFSSTEERIETSFEYDKYDYAIEGCNKGYFTFSRIGLELNQIDQPVVLKYLIEGNAINGTDYDTILDSIIIPAFQNSISLEINPLIDTVVDPNENLTISIINDCPALPPTFTATILINEFFEHTIPSTYVCNGESIQLNIPSNTSKYNILWDTNNELSCFECHSPFSTPDSSASYGYTLTDPVTGCFSKDDIDVTVLPLAYSIV